MEDKKGFVIAIVILSLISLGLGGFLVYDKIIQKRAEEKKETCIEDNKIDLNAFFNISKTLDSFDKAFNNPKSLYIGYIYVDKRLMASKFDMGAAIYASMMQDITVSAPPIPFYVSEEKVKGNFEKIFGKNLEYKATNVQSGEIYKVSYFNFETNPPVRYDYYAPSEENPYADRYIAINNETSIEEGKVIVNRKIFFAEFVKGADGVSYTGMKIYKDHSKVGYIGQVPLKNGVYSEKEVIEKNGSKLLTYDYTFVQNKDADYSFYSIEAVK